MTPFAAINHLPGARSTPIRCLGDSDMRPFGQQAFRCQPLNYQHGGSQHDQSSRTKKTAGSPGGFYKIISPINY